MESVSIWWVLLACFVGAFAGMLVMSLVGIDRPRPEELESPDSGSDARSTEQDIVVGNPAHLEASQLNDGRLSLVWRNDRCATD